MPHHLLLLVLHEEVLQVPELDLEIVGLVVRYFLLSYIKHYQQDLVFQPAKLVVVGV